MPFKSIKTEVTFKASHFSVSEKLKYDERRHNKGERLKRENRETHDIFT